MPELPEVETVRRTLAGVLTGRRVAAVEVRSAHCLAGPATEGGAAAWAGALTGRTFAGFDRRGKYLLVRLDSGLLVVHLRMTGRLVYHPAGAGNPRGGGAPLGDAEALAGGAGEAAPGEPGEAAGEGRGAGAPAPDRHTHLVLRLEGGGEVHFWDQRKFGRLYLFPAGAADGLAGAPWEDGRPDGRGGARADAHGRPEGVGPAGERREALLPAGLAHLGPEPLSPAFTPEALAAALAGRRTRIKAALLDQGVVAGLGNIYADEALFLAGIHPERAAGSLSAPEVDRLWQAIRDVLTRAIAHRGTTFSDYRDGLGERGGFAEMLSVYRREGRPCPRCGTPIARVKCGGRASRFCPACQR